MALSPAAQHAPLFISVCSGAMLSALGLGFWLLLAFCLKERGLSLSHDRVVVATRHLSPVDVW